MNTTGQCLACRSRSSSWPPSESRCRHRCAPESRPAKAPHYRAVRTTALVLDGGDYPGVDTNLTTTGPVKIAVYLSPHNDVLPADGLRYPVSVDDEAPRIVDLTAATDAAAMSKQWERDTSDDDVNVTITGHIIARPGPHVQEVWMVDPTVVVRAIVVDTGGVRPDYLGPPESRRW